MVATAVAAYYAARGIAATLGYALQSRVNITVTHVYDKGLNALDGLPQTFASDYRNFTHGVSALGLQYKFRRSIARRLPTPIRYSRAHHF